MYILMYSYELHKSKFMQIYAPLLITVRKLTKLF